MRPRFLTTVEARQLVAERFERVERRTLSRGRCYERWTETWRRKDGTDATAVDVHAFELLPNVPEDDLQSFLDGDMDDIGMLIDDHKLFGFLVRFDTPIVNKHGGYSWGYYTSKLVYADTFDGAVRAGLAWATAEHQKRSDR